MKGDFGFALAITVLLTIVLSGLYLTHFVDGDLIQMIGTVIGGLLAAYFGATAAMKHQRVKEKEDQNSQKVSLVNKALLALVIRRGWLRRVRSSVEMHREDDSRHLVIPAFVLPIPDVHLRLELLTSMVGVIDASTILRMAVEDLEFNSLVELIRMRDKKSEIFQESISKSGLTRKGFITHADIQQLGVSHLDAQLHDATDELYDSLDRLILSHEEAVKLLRTKAIEALPGGAFIRIVD